jgi:lipopolysaccharide biosynthesis glycosyltransferase
MWMNLEGLREIDFTSRSIAARASIGEARQGDQSVFNFLCRGRSFILPDSINHRTAIGSSRELCEGNLDLNLHYIGSPKPWLGPPKTSNWLAHRLWHQANEILFPDLSKTVVPLPHDQSSIRRKAMLYSVLNPSRAAHYRNDLASLSDPARVLGRAADHWVERLPSR